MGLSVPPKVFGIHSLCFYNRTTGVPISIVKLIGEFNLDFKAASVDLKGGSYLVPLDSTITEFNAETSFQCKELKGDLLALLSGGTLTSNVAESGGAVDNFVNLVGTSVKNATTGLDAISVTPSTGAASLKKGKYAVKAVTTTTANVYAMTDIDFKRGTDAAYTDDTGLVHVIDISSADDAVAELGLTFEKGSGTIAFVVGDVATFEVRAPNTGSYELEFGSTASTFQEVGVYALSAKNSAGDTMAVDLYRVAVGGFGVPLKEKTYSEFSVTLKIMYDDAKDAIGKLIYEDAA